MRKYIIISLLTLVTLTGCQIYGKFKPIEPEADDIPLPTYDQFFTDPQLLRLIDTALANNNDLKVAHENVRQAEATLLGAKLAYVPSIYLSPSATYGNTTEPKWQYGFAQASWEIDIFGRLTNRKRMADAARRQALDYEQAARTELIAAVAQTYYSLVTLDACIEINDSAISTWRNMVETQRAMKDVGLSDEAAVAQFEGSYHAACAYGEDLRLKRTQVINAFGPLLGSVPDNISRLKLSDARINENLTVVNLQVVRARPDVRAAERNLEMAFYNNNLAVANCCPSITLNGSVGLFNGGIIYQAVGSLLQPLFNSGRNIAEVRIAKSQKEAARCAYEQALLKAGMEVNNALAARQTYFRKTVMLTSQVNAMERAFDATDTKMHLGGGTYLEVLTAENALIQANFDLINNHGAILQSQVDLYLAMGGGKFVSGDNGKK